MIGTEDIARDISGNRIGSSVYVIVFSGPVWDLVCGSVATYEKEVVFDLFKISFNCYQRG